jgi:hypothetical protein
MWRRVRCRSAIVIDAVDDGDLRCDRGHPPSS